METATSIYKFHGISNFSLAEPGLATGWLVRAEASTDNILALGSAPQFRRPYRHLRTCWTTGRDDTRSLSTHLRSPKTKRHTLINYSIDFYDLLFEGID